jgi:hypothetical protein
MDLYGWIFSTTGASGTAGGRRGRVLAAGAVLLLGIAATASADFRLTDPTSSVYYDHALLAGTKLKLGERATATGNVHSNGTLEIGEHASIAGNASSVGKLTNHGTITGTTSSPAPALTLPVLASKDDLRRLANRVLTGNQTFTNAVIDDVVFVDGDVKIHGTLRGTGTIIAAKDLRVDEAEGQISLDPATRLSLIAMNDVKLGEKRALRGALYAGRDVTLGESASFEGVAVAGRELTLGEKAQLRFLDLDQVPPTIQLLSPADGALLATARPGIQVGWSDAFSGLKLSTARLLLDGTDRTAQATVSAAGLQLTPSQGLPEGPHTIDVTIADNSANVAHAVFHFTTDTLPPAIAITSPTTGQVVSNPAFQVTGTVTDASAIASLTVNGQAAARSGNAFSAAVTLAAGSNTITVAAIDAAGNASQATATVTLQQNVAPTLAIVAPAQPVYVDPTIASPVPDVVVTYASASPGLDLGTLRVALQNLGEASGPLILTCVAGPAQATCPMPLPQEGQFQIDAAISDLAGRGAVASFHFAVHLSADNAAPVLTVNSPADGVVVKDALLEVTGTATDDSGVALVLVNGPQATLTGSAFSAQIVLQPGTNRVLVAAVDQAGKVTEVTRTVVLDTTAPTLAFTAPENGKVTDQGSIAVVGTVGDDGAVTVTVNGSPASIAGGGFAATVPLAEGTNRIEAVATDLAGNSTTAVLQVVRLSPPAVTITSPAQMSLVAAPTVEVRGTVDPPVGSVAVNGVPAAVAGNTFTAQVPLIEGTNVVAAVATTSSGATGTGTVQVFRDSTAPRVAVAFPADGATVHDPAVPVGGTVQDNTIVAAGPLRVTVNGVAAAVTDGGFLLPAVTLALGDNTLDVVATDPAGNSVRQQVAVRFEPLAGEARIAVVSGDLQTGRIRSALAAPLVVSLADAAGHAAAAQTVVFRITGDDGSLSDGTKSGRSLSVMTDAQGRAAISWTLGDRTGLGKNRVRAASAGFAGEASFTASAQPAAATRLQLDTGNNQTGVAGRPLPRPFVVVATDEALNPIVGAPLTFLVTKGDGSLGGQPVVHAVTGEEGRVSVFLSLGAGEGTDNNVVAATLDGVADAAAIFYASGQVAGAPEATTVSGVVLDNVDAPVPGVTLRIPGTALATQADAAGRFTLGPAPVGDIRLVVDGSTAARPGIWPGLEFDLTTISGRDNTVGRPIYLLPLDLDHGLFVDETHGGTLTVPEIPGFSLTIAPGAAAFPDGGRSGLVSVTLVHADKVPMVPSLGQQPQFTVTIQPPGIRFDPPAKVTLPNVEGFPPGAITQIFSFLHDQGQFEAVGPATVSEDGALVVSDPGFGIVHGGWHYQPPPPPPDPPTNACHCAPQCQQCILGACGITLGSCNDDKFCTEHDSCQQGACTGTPIEDVDTGEDSIDLTNADGIVEAIDHLINIGHNKIPFCEPPKLDHEPGGSFVVNHFKRCCENRRATLPGRKFGVNVGWELEGAECLIPGLAWDLGPIGKFGVFIGLDASAGIHSSVGRNPCDESEECPTGIPFDFDAEGSAEFKLKGGLEVIVAARDVLSVTGGVQGGGSVGIEFKCGSPHFTGLTFGPAEAFLSATFLDFIHISRTIEIHLP